MMTDKFSWINTKFTFLTFFKMKINELPLGVGLITIEPGCQS